MLFIIPVVFIPERCYGVPFLTPKQEDLCAWASRALQLWVIATVLGIEVGAPTQIGSREKGGVEGV